MVKERGSEYRHLLVEENSTVARCQGCIILYSIHTQNPAAPVMSLLKRLVKAQVSYGLWSVPLDDPMHKSFTKLAGNAMPCFWQ